MSVNKLLSIGITTVQGFIMCQYIQDIKELVSCRRLGSVGITKLLLFMSVKMSVKDLKTLKNQYFKRLYYVSR